MINKKTLLSIGSGLTILTGLVAFTTAPSFADKKPAIEVVTHDVKIKKNSETRHGCCQ